MLDMHMMIIQSEFNRDITDQLMTGAISVLDKAKASYEHYVVPGVFEIPAMMQFAIKGMEFAKARRRFSGYIGLGCVIRGETSHYDHVADSTFEAIQEMIMRYTLAFGNGILTVENYDQALERANLSGRNWGAQAAETCLEMIKSKGKFALFPRAA